MLHVYFKYILNYTLLLVNFFNHAAEIPNLSFAYLYFHSRQEPTNSQT
jgi:hypothetical protein